MTDRWAKVCPALHPFQNDPLPGFPWTLCGGGYNIWRMNRKEKVEIRPVEEGGFVRIPESVLKALGLSPGKEVKIRLTGDRVTLERHIADPFAEYRNRPEAPSMDDLIQADAEKKEAVSKEFEERLKEKPEFSPEDHPDFWR